MSPGLNNGERLLGTAICPGAIVSGGYSVTASRDEGDLEKLIPSIDAPSEPSSWTVMVVANANVQPFVLTVYATCAG